MFEHHARHVRPLSPVTVRGVKFKRYELFYPHVPDDSKVNDGDFIDFILGSIPKKLDSMENMVGFCILHYARDGYYFLSSRWYGENMLKHEASRLQNASGSWMLASLAEERIVACIWELEIIGFERDAWVKTVMAEGGRPEAFERYIATTISGWV